MVLLRLNQLSVAYNEKLAERDTVYAVNDVSFEVEEGSIVGILGESGCGKTTLMKTIMRALPENGTIRSGEVVLDGKNLLSIGTDQLRSVRWDEMAYIPQSAMGSLDPVYTIGDQLKETVEIHRPKLSKSEIHEKAINSLELVGIDPTRLEDYPHQLSGGMRQRVLVAMAFLLNPKIVLADEPTTGVDVLTRDRILSDIESLCQEFDTSVLIVSHDVADLVETCDLIYVMYGGRIVEWGNGQDLFSNPYHPYTIALRDSLPELHERIDDILDLGMEPPDLQNPPDGCCFIDKCPFRIEKCREAHPELMTTTQNRASACYRNDKNQEFQARSQEVRWGNN